MPAIIKKYFPHLSEAQLEKFDIMLSLYPQWNEKINVISRKDIDNLETHHLLHSLAIAKFISFTDNSEILDMGTGGGLPGLPLAVLFPSVRFHLIDRIGKKINVAKSIAAAAGIDNATFQHGDIGECKGKFDFIVSRAVMPQNDLMRLVRRNISGSQRNAIPNGLITLKGGELSEELKGLPQSETAALAKWYDDPFFKTKKLIYTPSPR